MEALARRAAGERRVALLNLTREYRAHRHELLAACERVLERMQLLGGEEVRAFESEMAAYLGVRQVRGVASGTDALALALQAAGLEPGDEVLVQANAFVAAVEAIQRAGGTPVAVDIRLDDLGPDPDDLAARLTPLSRAVLVVHLHGLPVDLRPILALARARGLVVIEDCSHAPGATLDARRDRGLLQRAPRAARHPPARRPDPHARLPSVRRAHPGARRAARPPGRARHRDRGALPGADSPPAGLAARLRRDAAAAARRAGGARDALAARARRPDRRGGRAGGGRRGAVLRATMSETEPPLALSIVVPVYNEEGNVEPLHGELTRVARELGRPYELVFVNDGSRDGTLGRLSALRARDEHLRIVDLDGNFGEAAALSAGFAHARGALVVTLDGDGQNDPADIPRLLARLVLPV